MKIAGRPLDRILLTGASGLIGGSLKEALRREPVEIVQLVRSPSPTGDQLLWDPYSAIPIADASVLASLEGISAAIHLSGANIADHRWTSRFEDVIRQSRQQPTQALSRVLAGLKSKPKVLIAASAVGIYGNRGDDQLSETSLSGNGFLAEVCRAWEEAAQPAREAGIRVIHLRFGVVISRKGGALSHMLPLFRLGLGGRLGSGKQWMSWVGLPDVLRVIEFVLGAEDLSGPINVVAPYPVTNKEFTRTLGHVLRRPALLAVPSFALKLAFGSEMANSTLLASQRVIPERLQAAGYRFESPNLETVLQAEIL